MFLACRIYNYKKLFTNLLLMKRSGYADLPLHGGQVPPWLATRMTKLGTAIVEALIYNYGRGEVLTRLSDPFWFQALGSVMGMDWHSSGITTSVMGALKRGLNPRAHELGIYICGGRGKHSRMTPLEIEKIADRHGLAGDSLARYSRLTAKVDNTAVQDGFQLYLHSFVVSLDGEWAVIQQGMNSETLTARRYHWHSADLRSFTEEPHAAIVGEYQGEILNLVHRDAVPTQERIIELLNEKPGYVEKEARHLVMPRSHQVSRSDINLKRLGAVLAVAHDREIKLFSDALLIQGMGPRTLQSLALVSEVIHGTPTRFSDPARFSFAHGGKDRRPFPVPTKIYDRTIEVLGNALERAKLGETERLKGFKRLHEFTRMVEEKFDPQAGLEKTIEKEFADSPVYGGRSVFGWEKDLARKPQQLKLFEQSIKSRG
jgi:hypothetical protein